MLVVPVQGGDEVKAEPGVVEVGARDVSRLGVVVVVYVEPLRVFVVEGPRSVVPAAKVLEVGSLVLVGQLLADSLEDGAELCYHELNVAVRILLEKL